MKLDWKKTDKRFYLPKDQPEWIHVPDFKFFSIRGAGNPNDEFFGEYIGVLYSLSYAIRMSPKQGLAPAGYQEYTVFPLEGVWDISEMARKNYMGVLDKNALVFNLMIRQPDFVTEEYALETIRRTMLKKPHPLLEQVRFEVIGEGDCIQMMHIGPYDTEPESFNRMEAFATSQNWVRRSRIHREIYMSDPRKLAPDKLRTVLRIEVEKREK